MYLWKVVFTFVFTFGLVWWQLVFSRFFELISYPFLCSSHSCLLSVSPKWHAYILLGLLHLIFPLQSSFFPFLFAWPTSNLSCVNLHGIISERFFANIKVEDLSLDFPYPIIVLYHDHNLASLFSFWKSCVCMCVFVSPLNFASKMTTSLSFLFPNLSSVLQIDNFWYIIRVWEIHFSV